MFFVQEGRRRNKGRIRTIFIRQSKMYKNQKERQCSQQKWLEGEELQWLENHSALRATPTQQQFSTTHNFLFSFFIFICTYIHFCRTFSVSVTYALRWRKVFSQLFLENNFSVSYVTTHVHIPSFSSQNLFQFADIMKQNL